jgi:predicted ATPase
VKLVADDGRCCRTFQFINSIVQEILYESLSLSTRRNMHKQIAELLEQSHTQNLAALASHWQNAEHVRKSCEYFAKGMLL